MIRPYTLKDKLAILALVKLNTPKYFHPEEEQDLALYLENELEEYFVFEQDGKVLGAGGINYFPEKKEARISWDVVSPAAQGKGIGSQLTQFRIKQAFSNGNVKKLIVRTSQLVYPFYEKQGFTLEKVEKDYWAEGYDLYQMLMERRVDKIVS